MKQYKSNITKDFCMQWSKSKSIQEYTSNMLDQGDYSFDFQEDGLTLTNHNVRVSHKALLLGLSDKTGESESRGQFGCGVPQSMAALLAQDVEITIRNAGVIWTPSFIYCDDWEEEVLVIEERADPCRGNSHYSVEITNLTEEDIEEVKIRCLEFQDREVLYSTSIGDIISGGEGEIYSGEIYVGENSDFKYSYNFKPNVVPLTQDRNFVDPFELKKLTAKLISMVEDDNFVKEAIEANSADTKLVVHRDYTDRRSYESTHAAVDLFGEEFVEENEATLVTSDYTEHQNNEKNNILSVFEANAVKAKSIQESQAYQDSIEDIETVEKLSPYEAIEQTKEDIREFLIDARLNTEYTNQVLTLLDNLLTECDEGNWY